MNNQSIAQQPKPDPKGKATASLILGVAGVIVIIGHIYNTLEGWTIDSFRIPEMFKFTKKILEPLGTISYLFLLVPIISLILGIKGLKSTKKNIAVGGIILSVIGIFGLVIFLLLCWGFATGM